MMSRYILYSFLATFCMARIHQGEHRETLSILPGRPILCIEDNNECDPDSNCDNCCSGITYTNDNATLCGYGACLEDGTICSNVTHYQCYQCCNGAYDNGGKTCGGQCLTSGTSCDIDSTCGLCCNYTTVKIDEDSYECGCLEDGKKCIPGETCYSCCNGAYDDNGYTCGGTCLTDGKVCTPGKDCHLCCTYSSYWYSTGQMQCGAEPCYEDGKSCIPGVSCYNCCSGGAFKNDGTVCGGSCLKAGSKCSYFGSCNKCCQDYPEIGPLPFAKTTDSTNTSSEVAISTTGLSVDESKMSFPYPLGGPSHWSATKKSMVCGYEVCWEDGKSCIPGYNCHNCCNGAYTDGGTKCGGTCLATGKKCSYFSTCSQCCMTYKYNTTLSSHVCVEYETILYPDDTTDSEVNDTIAIDSKYDYKMMVGDP
jgi:hypothetical protein